jgi:hypothetical protein
MARVATTRWFATLAFLFWLALPLPVIGQEPEATLHGEYAVTIAAEDVPPDLIDGASVIGRWYITFNGDGSYILGRQDVGPLVNGQFEVDGDRLMLLTETGVLACVAEDDGGAAATYTWQLNGDQLQLIAVEEPCARRRLLLTTRTLSTFTACPVQASERSDSGAATPRAASETPSPGDEDDDSRLALEAEIDDVLRQMSDCWATREPDRFLQLLSREFREAQFPADEDGLRGFTLAMAAPIVWDRVGEVSSLDETRATAIVRQTSGDNIDEAPYAFVFEDGAWRWDGAAEASDAG